MGLNLDRLTAAAGNADHEVDLALFWANKIFPVLFVSQNDLWPFSGRESSRYCAMWMTGT